MTTYFCQLHYIIILSSTKQCAYILNPVNSKTVFVFLILHYNVKSSILHSTLPISVSYTLLNLYSVHCTQNSCIFIRSCYSICLCNLTYMHAYSSTYQFSYDVLEFIIHTNIFYIFVRTPFFPISPSFWYNYLCQISQIQVIGLQTRIWIMFHCVI